MEGLVLLVLAVALYFLPTIIGRNKRNNRAIFALNLFLGWTLVGWVVALVWALTLEPTAPQVSHVPVQHGAFCNRCGAQLTPRSRYCSSCGAGQAEAAN